MSNQPKNHFFVYNGLWFSIALLHSPMTADLIRDGIVVYEKAKEKGDKDSVPFN